MADFELWAEDGNGHNVKLCETSNQQYGAIIGEAVWHMQAEHEGPAHARFRCLWMRDIADLRNPRMMDRWPASQEGSHAEEN